MKQENDLTPFQCSPLPKGPWLVFAPHPDDESFGMGGSLLLAARQGIEVNLVFMTDGARSGSEDRDQLVRIRKKEATNAAKKVNAREIFFLNQPDRKLTLSEKLVGQITDLIKACTPSSIFFPSPLELHPDHRQTALLAWQAIQHSQLKTLDAYGYDISVQGQINQLIDITSVVDEKRELMGLYKSQLEENDYINLVASLDKARTYTLSETVQAAEGFYLYPSTGGELNTHTLSSLKSYWQDRSPLPENRPLISVIIRTKNRPELLKQAISSVAEQTYNPIELVVVNDGGSDISSIVNSYQKNFDALNSHVFTSTSGRSLAANKGLTLASGDYILFLDDDDWLAPEHLSSLLKTFEAHTSEQLVAAYSSTECIDTRTGETVRVYDQPYDAALLRIENYIPLHALLFKKSAINGHIKCRFDKSLDLYEDWDFWLQLSKQGDFIHSGLMTAYYRITDSSGEGVSADEQKSLMALKQITGKWAKKLSEKDYRDLIGRARFLQRKVAESEQRLQLIEKHQMAQLNNTVRVLNEEYGKEISRLEKTHSSDKQNLASTYEREIQRLAEEAVNIHKLYDKKTANELATIGNNYEHEIRRLGDNHAKELLRTQSTYEDVLERQNQQHHLAVEKLINAQAAENGRHFEALTELNHKKDALQRDQKTISENYEREVARLSASYHEILSSKSWQMTRPLRFVRRLVTGKAGNPLQAIKKQLMILAIFLYRLPVTSKLIRRLPFTFKQRIRNMLSPCPLPASREYSQCESPLLDDEGKKRVSIIIPVYNHAEYLDQCIASAVNQTWQDTEIVICDDASPDPEVKLILKKYESVPRCNVLYSEVNGGICRTQNKLLAAATGNIIAFLDCDDYLAPHAVELCMQQWQDDTIYLHTGRINVDDEGREVNRISFEHLPRKDYFEENLERMYATHFKLIHRGAIARVGAFDTRFDSAQDYDLLMRIAFHYPSEAFVHIPDFLYFHRFHEQQTTGLMNTSQLQSTATIQSEARLRKAISRGDFKHFLSFIMLSYGKKTQTLEALKSLQKTVRVPHEIILFDNGSEPDTVNFIKSEIEGKFDHVKIFYNDMNLGPAAGRRAALEHASGEWFIIFDNDEIAENGWLEELLVRACSDDAIGAVCCKVIFPDNSLQFSGGFLNHKDDQLVELDLYDRGTNTYELATAVFRDCDWCPIGATLFTVNPAEFLHQGYPNVFEDAGVSMQLKKRGKRLVNSPGSWVWHEHITFQNKSEVDMHDKYISERYNPKRMLISLKSFYNENGFIIHDEYIWRENGLYSLSREELKETLSINC